MAKVITLSRKYPHYHPLKGTPTRFVEKFYNWYFENDIPLPDGFKGTACAIDVLKHMNPLIDEKVLDAFVLSMNQIVVKPKLHTIRSGYRFKSGDLVSVRTWGNDLNPKSGRSGPYHSKQIILAQDLPVDLYKFDMDKNGVFLINDRHLFPENELDLSEKVKLADNDGLVPSSLFRWFMKNIDKPNDFHGQIISWGKVDY